ncbi:MAG: MFS transporter [Burkholderiales bacterium]|nr:MFS transporter [Burkholderiales bacterium]
MIPHRRTLQREPVTFIAYATAAYFTLVLNVIGPALPHLRAELGLRYAEAALHTSAFALGMMLCGLFGERVVRATGRRAAVWVGAVGMAAGLTLVAFAPTAPISIAGCALMGLVGTLQLVVMPAVISERHGDSRVIAFSEQNILAMTGALIAPLAVAAAVAAGTWRIAGVVGWIGVIAMALLFLRVEFPAAPAPPAKGEATLPARYWALWSLLLLTVATEFCMMVWGPSYLEAVLGLPRHLAIVAGAAFPLGMVLGRGAGIVLLRRFPEDRFVVPSIALAFCGFLLFWKAPTALLALAGLLVAGLGIANLYPCGIALALAAAGRATTAAAARASLGAGFAILSAPLALGALADTVGLAQAYAVVPFLLAAAVVAFTLSRRPAAAAPAKAG